MNRRDFEKKIREKYPELNSSNLKYLQKSHLEQWVNTDEIILSSSILVKIFQERNERAKINQKVNQENFGLRAKLGSITNTLTDWNKSEIIQQFKNLFGKVSKNDDQILGEIGAISKESAREDLEKAQQVIEDAQDIARQLNKKYRKLR